MKLQKLLYYSNAWHLVWAGKPLFNEQIQAWANGPVVASLYGYHRGKYMVSDSDFYEGDATKLTEAEITTVSSVLTSYGAFSAAQLSALTHAEDPWKNARLGTPEGLRSNSRISDDALTAYYTHLAESADAVHDAAEINFPGWAR